MCTKQPLLKHGNNACFRVVCRPFHSTSAEAVHGVETRLQQKCTIRDLSQFQSWLAGIVRLSCISPALILQSCLSPALILHESQTLLLFIAPCFEGLRGLATFPLKERMPTWLQYVWGQDVYSAFIMPYCHAENSFFLFLSSLYSVCLSFVTNPSVLVYFLFYAPYFRRLFTKEERIRSQSRIQTVVKTIHPRCAS